jgi:hypothetical protein
LDFVVSSSVIAVVERDCELFSPVAPVVPVGSLALLPEAGPSNSVRILSMAATSLLQVFLDDAVGLAAVLLSDDFSSAFRWRLSSATFAFAGAGMVAGTSFNAACAWRRCS